MSRARLMKKKVSSADAAAYNLYISIYYTVSESFVYAGIIVMQTCCRAVRSCRKILLIMQRALRRIDKF